MSLQHALSISEKFLIARFSLRLPFGKKNSFPKEIKSIVQVSANIFNDFSQDLMNFKVVL